jgi:HAD superfamily hydrolase (TIGR01509 family)
VVSACLVDVYDTILSSDFRARVRALTASIGVDTDAWIREWLKTGTERGVGKLSMADSFAKTLRGCGIAPSPALVASLVDTDAELLRDGSRLFGDTVPFLGELRSRGLGIALVSNCSQSTRQMLEHLGVIPLTDVAILSCEAGSLKPSPEIYLAALEALAVMPEEAVMLDDQPRFCAGAEAVGIRAIQVARDSPDSPNPEGAGAGFPVASTLLDALPLL